MEKVRYAEMLPHEIVERRRRCPVAFIGLGILEWHGEHLAVGNDALKAEKLCEMAAQRMGAFAFPTLWYGEPRTWAMLEHNDATDTGVVNRMFELDVKRMGDRDYFRKSEEQQKDFYKQLVKHMLIQANTLGMKAVCLLCGHYPLIHMAGPAVEEFHAEYKGTRAFAQIECDYLPPNPDVGGDHAAKWETSFLMYLRPECVDMTVYLGRENDKLHGVGGEDPRKYASVEVGRKGCDLVVDAMVAKARQLLQEAG